MKLESRNTNTAPLLAELPRIPQTKHTRTRARTHTSARTPAHLYAQHGCARTHSGIDSRAQWCTGSLPEDVADELKVICRKQRRILHEHVAEAAVARGVQHFNITHPLMLCYADPPHGRHATRNARAEAAAQKGEPHTIRCSSHVHGVGSAHQVQLTAIVREPPIAHVRERLDNCDRRRRR